MGREKSHDHGVRLDARPSLLRSPQHLTPGALCRSLHSRRQMFLGASSFDCCKIPDLLKAVCQPGLACTYAPTSTPTTSTPTATPTTFDFWTQSSINTHTEALAKHEAELAESKSAIDTVKDELAASKSIIAESKSTIVALTTTLAKVQATIDSIDDTCIDSSNRRRLSRCLDGEFHSKSHAQTPRHISTS